MKTLKKREKIKNIASIEMINYAYNIRSLTKKLRSFNFQFFVFLIKFIRLNLI